MSNSNHKDNKIVYKCYKLVPTTAIFFSKAFEHIRFMGIVGLFHKKIVPLQCLRRRRRNSSAALKEVFS